MPTLKASTPDSMRLAACLAVTTLPPTTSIWGYLVLMNFTISCWYMESPWDESITITSTPACKKKTRRHHVPMSAERILGGEIPR